MSRRFIQMSKTCFDKFRLPKRFEGTTHSVWMEYTQLFLKYQPVNLSFGFTDAPVPKHITNALADSATNENHFLNQYTRDWGHPRLVHALSALYSRLVGRKIDPLNEILVTVGAWEALYAAIQSHIDDEDEVIIIEPFFDTYEPVVKICGGIVRSIPLRLKNPNSRGNSSADYALDDEELASLFNSKTKMIILNTPNNPFGKVFTRAELTKIADLCIKYNVLCVSDEVYEWMVYDGSEHVRICTLPGMWERTITIGSAGKALGTTGWKVGWAYAPANLIAHMQIVHQNSVGTNTTPIQEAIAIVFEAELERFDSPECYFNTMRLELQEKRDFMVNLLKEVKMEPIIPQAGYFILADWTALEDKIDLNSESDPQKDYRVTKWMTKNIGLQPIPPSVFCSEKNKNLMENFVRFCFSRKDETLQKAAEILRNWTSK